MERQLAFVASLAEHWISWEALTAAAAQKTLRRQDPLRLRQLMRITAACLYALEETGRVESTIRDGTIFYRQACSTENSRIQHEGGNR